MTEQEWLESADPFSMLEYVRGTASDRKLRLIAVASCRRAKEFTEHWYQELADIAEAFAEGRATVEEMRAVYAQHRPSNDYPDRNAFYDTAGFDLAEKIPCLVEDLADWIGSCKADAENTSEVWEEGKHAAFDRELAITAGQVREIIGNPFQPVSINSAWQTPAVVALAHAAYESGVMPAGTLEPVRLAVLADALEEAGCDNADILKHCREPREHVRGCWVVDLLLVKG